MESFFSSLKQERIRRKIYNTREELKAEIFDCIEVFYNRIRRHSYLSYLSPIQFEQQQLGHGCLSTKMGEVHGASKARCLLVWGKSRHYKNTTN